MALPVYSVETLEEAKQLFVLLGKLDRWFTGYSGLQHYRLTGWTGEYEDLDKASEQLHAGYQRILATKILDTIDKQPRRD